MIKLNCIHLAHKKNTENCPISSIPLPENVEIPMSMNMGTSCEPIVKVGDLVKVGQIIGNSDTDFAVPVHSSVSGKVISIGHQQKSDGTNCQTIIIKCDGLQTVSDTVKPPKITNKKAFVKAVRSSGLVGLGGAGFPTHIKLNPKKKIDTLIVNGAECEPYITSDYRTMLEHTDELIEGISIIAKHLDAEKIIIGIEKNKPEAIRLLTEKTASDSRFTIKSLPAVYPQGGEKVLIYNCTGKLIREKQFPADAGVVVINVSTAAALNIYLKTGMPLVNRTVTVDGDTVKKPGNYLVPIGTNISYLLGLCECQTEKINKLILGGPMMGLSALSLEQPVTKVTNAVLAMNKVESNRESACIHCGRCMKACPFSLMPNEIEKACKLRDSAALKRLKVNLCMNCGCCTYVCPAKRKLAETNQLAKHIMMHSK